MQVSGIRVLGLSFAIGLGVGVVGGVGFALAADRVIAHGIGAGLFFVGLVIAAIGLLGATEPPGGWRNSTGRRGLATTLANDHPQLSEPTSLDLLVWGLVVGGGLIGLSMVAFYLAAR